MTQQSAKLERDRRLGKPQPAPATIFKFPEPIIAPVVPIPEPVVVPIKDDAHDRQLQLLDLKEELAVLRGKIQDALGECEDAPLPTPVKPILRIIATYYEISIANLLGTMKPVYYVRPRHVAMYLARKITGRSYPAIGRAMGNRDHTSVMHGHDRIAARIQTDPVLRAEVEELTTILMRKSHVG